MQSESSFQSQLNYTEAVAGLLHYQFSVLNLTWKAHRHGDDETGGLRFWMDSIHRSTSAWNWDNAKIKCFRDCDAFFNHLLDAHILVAVGKEAGATTWNELKEVLSGEYKWRKAISAIGKKFGDPLAVYKLRADNSGERDLVYENAILFLQHGLLYRRFSRALKTGDSGVVMHCLKYFTLWFLNDDRRTSCPNYRQESLHLMACLTHIWSERLRQHWLENCLVNLSGSKTGFMTDDQLCEYVVRETKDQINHNTRTSDDHFTCEVKARQVIIFKEARDNMYKVTGATRHYQHSSTVSATVDVRTMADQLFKYQVFTQQPGRKTYDTSDKDVITESVDLLGVGAEVLAKGQVLADYKIKMGGQVPDEEDSSLEGDEDDDVLDTSISQEEQLM